MLWLCRHTQLVHNNLHLQAATVVTGIIFVVAIFAIFNLPLVLKVLSLVGLGQYSNYLEGEQMQLMLSQIVLRLPLLVVLLASWKELCKNDKAAPLYLALLLLDMVMSQLVSVDTNTLRIGAYFSVYTILWIPSVYRVTKPGVKRTVIALLCICYAVFYWYYTYIYSLRHETYPYMFFNGGSL